jgi:hypothetical protein
MRILSAADAISPAFARTRLVLFFPFRWGRTWKLGATAYLATAGTFFLPFGLIYLGFIPMARRAGGNAAVVALVVALLLLTVLQLYFLYLFTRIRFAFFDIVLNRGSFVAPAWRKYGPPSYRWTLFKVLLGTLITAVFAFPLAAWFRQIFTAMVSFQPGQQPPPQVVFSLLAGYFFVYFVLGLFFFITSLLSDFIVPSLALENTTLGEAFRRLGQLIRNEPGQFTLYALLKLVLAIAGYMGLFIGLEIVIFLVALIVGLIAFCIGYLLHSIGVPMLLLTVLGVALAVAVYLFFVVYVLILLFGILLTFLESYTLYFLGGRYPMLGDLLDHSTPLPPVVSPPPYAVPPIA